jgi:hypothetical protein
MEAELIDSLGLRSKRGLLSWRISKLLPNRSRYRFDL